MSESLFPTRVRYSDRQFLQAADLQADQAYHRQARWRHNLALHSWGVLAGLEVSVTGTNSTTAVAVTAGMALDGYGRELVLQADRPLERLFLDRNQSYDVWLVYGEEPEPPPKAAPRGGCATAAAAVRVRETPILRVTKTADRRSASPSQPDGVPVGDLDFGPERSSPPLERAWPVFLARLDFRDDGEGEMRWLPDTTERRYAGLVAERIAAPQPPDVDGKAQARTVLVNGADPDEPDLRFAVASTTATGNATPPFIAVRTGPNNSARIELQSDRVLVAGDMTLRDGAALQFAPNRVTPENTDPHAQPLTGSDHWRVYHHFSPPPPTDKPPPGPNFFDELRITMPSVPAGANRVVIGFFGEKGKFEPVLAVLDNQSVEVYGTLRVTGEIVGRQAKLPADTTTGGGRPNPDAMKRQVEQYLNAGGAPADVLAGLIGKGDTAIAAAAVATGVWEDTQVEPLVKQLLSKPALAKLFAEAVFKKDVTRAVELVQGMPATYTTTDEPLTSFAGELWANKPQLKALVDALIAKAPPNPVAVPTDAEIVDTFAKWLAEKAPKTSVDQLFVDGRFSANLKLVGEKVAAAAAVNPAPTAGRLQNLLAGLASNTTVLAAFAAELIDDVWDGSSTKGKDALAEAFGHLLTIDNPADTSLVNDVPEAARLRAFFHYVRKQIAFDGSGAVTAETKKFLRLQNSIRVLGKNIETLPPT